MSGRENDFGNALSEFPPQVRDILAALPTQGGRLDQGQCSEVMGLSGLDLEGLMVRLLPLARAFAQAPISGFKVGAVAQAHGPDQDRPAGLFLGANLEFTSGSLCQTIHAEQAAAANAWHRGARHLTLLAASEPPCGFCRQFLQEFQDREGIRIIIGPKKKRPLQKVSLADLLGQAFGPADLGNQYNAATSQPKDLSLDLETSPPDSLATLALEAARASYAPYSGNLAGCALETEQGRVFRGSYLESAAFNPSLSPLQAALIRLNLDQEMKKNGFKRVVLVERPTLVSQQGAVELMLKGVAPGVELEYFTARE